MSTISAPSQGNHGTVRQGAAAPLRDAQEPPRARPQYGRWRAGALITVYFLMAAHFVHWRFVGTTLAPLELNEVMYTFEAGIVTAGFVFMAVAMLSVLFFGRFFCSWGCHILALEDFCAWLLGRFGIRPRPIRSRLLLLVPPAALIYMFVWPQIARLVEGRPAPAWRIMSADDPWGSFLTTDFVRNLPGPFIALLTFAVCGCLIIYFLGSRSFCRYVCPYGAAFALADRLAPGRIIHVGAACDGCGVCTAACKSNILVHEEIRIHSKVVSPDCLKDLDCVAACPHESLRWGLATPALFQSWRKRGRRPRRWDASIGEELLIAVVFVASLLILRGLYDAVPFLLALGCAAVLSWMAVISRRLVRRPRVDLGRVALRCRGRLTGCGRLFAVIVAATLAFMSHSAVIRWHEWRGQAAFEELRAATTRHDAASTTAAAALAIRHLDLCDRFGLVRSTLLTQRLAGAHEWSEAPLEAEPHLRRLIDAMPRDVEPRLRLASLLIVAGRLEDAGETLAALDRIVESHGDAVDARTRQRVEAAHVRLAQLHEQRGRSDDAADQRDRAGPHSRP